ncbi:hypothetical protein [Rhodoflexus caldus]|uniref:hypothetical protein n=1 Tax=Rhodoflexus caldus TaxID=2891236 RepID=UPI002029CA70|nr:hypothetical protein [Rhodoflexus caldus]
MADPDLLAQKGQATFLTLLIHKWKKDYARTYAPDLEKQLDHLDKTINRWVGLIEKLLTITRADKLWIWFKKLPFGKKIATGAGIGSAGASAWKWQTVWEFLQNLFQ